MAAPNAAWLAAFSKAGVQPIFRAVLTTAFGTSYTCDSAPGASGTSYDVGLSTPTPWAASFDPLTRKVQISSVTVPFLDGFLRPLMVANQLQGKGLTITLGCVGMAAGDFCDYFAGTIERLSPEHGLTINVEALDAFSVNKGKTISFSPHLKSPLQIIASALSAAGTTPNLINETSLDPDDAANNAIGHHAISMIGNAGEDYGWCKDQNTLLVIEEMVQLTGGLLYTTHAGEVTFKIYDPTAAVVDTWTVDDFGGDIKQEATNEDPINRVTVQFAAAD